MSGVWIAKFRIRHDCILGNRCREFGVTLQSVSFTTFTERGRTFTSSMHYMTGAPKDLDRFVVDLKNDAAVQLLERKGDTFFLVEKAKSKAVGFHTPKLIFVKPVLLQPDGFEQWEVGSWEREEVSTFVTKVRNAMLEFKLSKFVRTPIDTVFFPKLMPQLTDKQKRVVELAISKGYYATPRRTDLRKLAKLAGISLATFQEHLRRSEQKLLPNALSYF